MRASTPSIIFLQATFVSAAILAWLGASLLLDGGVPFGDFAADMLLANRLSDDGVLLVGHYSRFGFNHPGPFWFYFNCLVEWSLQVTGASRPQLWAIGQVTLAAPLLAVSGCLLSHLLLGRVRVLPVMLVVITLIGFAGWTLVSIWMPHRLIIVYAAFLVCCCGLMQGTPRLLPLAVALASMLIHGYATMPVFTLPFLGAAFLYGYRKRKSPPHWPEIAISGLIAALFAAPLIYDALRVSPSNFSKLLYVQLGFAGLVKPTWQELGRFMNELMPVGSLWALGFSLLALVAFRANGRKAWGIWLMLGCVTLVFALYYKSTPAPLYAFTGLFYSAIPPLFLASVLLAVIAHAEQQWSSRTRLSTALLGAGLCLVLYFSPFARSPDMGGGGREELEQIAKYIKSNAQPQRPVALDYSQHELWTFLAGLMLKLDEQAVPICTTWQHMGYLYTPKHICPINQKPDYRLVSASECNGHCALTTSSYGIRSAAPSPLRTDQIAGPESEALTFLGWYPAETGHRWSHEKNASVLFVPATNPSKIKAITLRFASLGRQRVLIYLNNQFMQQTVLTGEETELQLPLVERLRNGSNKLHFELPDAQRPGGADARTLALSFKSIQLSTH